MTGARFQSFDDASDRSKTPARVAELRAELGRLGLAGFIVPRADRHQNEYVPPSDERLAWLTGFSGSAGARYRAVGSRGFVRRWTVHAASRGSGRRHLFAIVNIAETSPEAWLEPNSTAGAKLGYDSWLHTVEAAERLAKACSASGASLLPVAANPLDAIWRDRPPAPRGAIVVHDLNFPAKPPRRSSTASARKSQPQSRRARHDRPACAGLDLQHPRRRCRAYAARAWLCHHSKDGRPALYIDGEKLSPAVRRDTRAAGRACARPALSRRTAGAGRRQKMPSGSIKRPRPTPSIV